ncbi:XkdF-like putative serine protease domain-containing protein [Bacillus coahuilensis]|uniref:XkdF-like putative serine protease domain-containing protein n=1 Tax=Bacillus coahuilensis TaxID=408580 RepID=UPI0001851312|nr:XkdF-like putative serine protease domain-containing protein [Bacillus coahuilensis]
MPELSSPILGLNKNLQIMTGAVLIPDEPDSDGDVVSKERIESLAYEYMEKYQNSDLQHTLNNVAKVVESYITPFPMTVKAYGKTIELPAGTWIMSVKVSDPEIWQAVLDGKLTGFSIMGVRRSTLNDFSFKSATNEEISDLVNKSERTTLEDLGDFVITHVSIVDKPAVPKAEFFSLKSQQFEEKGLFKRFVEFMKDEQAKKTKGEDVEMTKEELKQFILSVFKEANTEEVEEETVEETETQEEVEDTAATTEEENSETEKEEEEVEENTETSTEETSDTEETDKKIRN